MAKKETTYVLDTKKKVVYVDFENIPLELVQKFALAYTVKDMSEKPQDKKKAADAKARAAEDITKADIEAFFADAENAKKYEKAKAEYDTKRTSKVKGKGLGFFAAKSAIKANEELYKAIAHSVGKKTKKEIEAEEAAKK